jgi:hypothetical protein
MPNRSSLSPLYNSSLFPIVFQHFPDTSMHVLINLIVVKPECGECLCETKKNERLDEQVSMLHCFVVEQWLDIELLADRSDCRKGSVWWVSTRNKKNERLDEQVWMLHCFVVEQWRVVELLHHRSDFCEGPVWWVSTGNKKNQRLDEKLGILHGFVLEQWQNFELLVDRYHWSQGSVRWVSTWKKEWEIGWTGTDVTLFFCRAVARCWAPCGPISLFSRSSVVSVYAKQKE